MTTLTTTRRLRGKKGARTNAPPRKYPHRTPLTGFVNGEGMEPDARGDPADSERSEDPYTRIGLAAQLSELQIRLDALHEAGVWTGSDHGAVCEALALIQRAHQRLRTAWSSVLNGRGTDR